MNKVYIGEAPSSLPIDHSQQEPIEVSMDTDPDEERVLSPRPRPDLSAIKKRLHEALGYSTDTYPCESPECPAHQITRPSPPKPLYRGPLSSHNVIPVIKPPKLPHHDWNLYHVYNDIAEEEESDVTKWERVVDERDIVQARNEMETIWREQMVKGYRNDSIYQLAQDSNNPSTGDKRQYYRIGHGLLYTTTRGEEECFYIPKGHRINR